MRKLQIINYPEIEYDEWIAKGIYGVHEKKRVKDNCKKLNITIGEPAPLEVIQKVTHLQEYGIVTIHYDTEYFQFIISTKASEEDFNKFLENMPKESKNVLIEAHSDILGQINARYNN